MNKLKLGSHNIKEKDLDRKEIKSNVFEQIYNDENNLFVSKTTKISLREYSEPSDDKKKDTKKLAKTLWKNLLKDAICLLKINDSREKLYQATESLLKESEDEFKAKFDSIRKTSSYGIDELASYFDDFVEFESVLYGTGEFYRDHIHHVLQVWGVGVGLLWGIDKLSLSLSEGYTVSDEDFHFQIETGRERCISNSELWAIWTIIALCHDLGYPLEKASQINQKVKKIVNHFGCLNFNELNFNFDVLNSFIVEKFLNIISSKTSRPKEIKSNSEKEPDEISSKGVVEPQGIPQKTIESPNQKNAVDGIIKSEKHTCPEKCINNRPINKTEIQHKYRDKFAKSLEDYQHGSLSGLLIFKKLTYFLETDFAQEKSSLDCEDLRQFYIRKEILRAICGHTCPKIYHLDLNTLPFLLILCDELQEWGRPRFEDLLSGETKDIQTTRIEKFIGPETNIHITANYKTLSVKEVGEKSVEKNIVRRTFKFLHFLLRSAKDDRERKVEFLWEIFLKDKNYSFAFTSNSNAYDAFRIRHQLVKPSAQSSSGNDGSTTEENYEWKNFEIYEDDDENQL